MALPKLNNARYSAIIPSTGQSVEYRPYLVKEEKILMMAMETNDPKQIFKATSDVIESCVYDDINVTDLAMVDIESLFLALRSKSAGEKIDLKVKCQSCNELNDQLIDLEDIEQPDFSEKETKIMLTDDVGMTLRLPSYTDALAAQDGKSDMDNALQLMVNCIDTIFDSDGVYNAKDEKRSTLVEFVESLNNEQFGRLGEFFADMPQLKYNMEFDCAHCGAKNSQELRGLQSFFT